MNLWRCSLIPKENPGAAAGASSVASDQHSLARMMLGCAMRLLDGRVPCAMLCALGPERRCGSVANTLHLFHNQREVDDSSLARRSGDGSGSIYDLLRL